MTTKPDLNWGELQEPNPNQAADATESVNELVEEFQDNEHFLEGFQRETALVAEQMSTLRRLRKQQDLTQEQLAAKAGMTQSEISRIEHRSNHTLETIKQFVESCGAELKLYAERDGKQYPLDL